MVSPIDDSDAILVQARNVTAKDMTDAVETCLKEFTMRRPEIHKIEIFVKIPDETMGDMKHHGFVTIAG